MAYATVSDVRDALNPTGSPTDPGSASGMTDEALSEAIGRATDEVNARLAGRYRVPFTDPVPGLITDVTVAVAAYKATLTHRQGELLLDRAPVWLAYENALDLLTGLADGSMVLPPPVDGGGGAVGGGGLTVVNPYAGDLFRPRDFGLSYHHRRDDCA